jgi:hypothetical protein
MQEARVVSIDEEFEELQKGRGPDKQKRKKRLSAWGTNRNWKQPSKEDIKKFKKENPTTYIKHPKGALLVDMKWPKKKK